MTHHVYYFWQDRTPLYIGVTGNLSRRLRQHKLAERPWVTNATDVRSIAFDSAGEAYAAEAEQIASLRPVYNMTHNPRFKPALDAYCECGYFSRSDVLCLEQALNGLLKRMGIPEFSAVSS